MDAARRRLFWWVGGAALAFLVIAAIFAAYLKPDMVAVFGDVMAFCVAILK